MSELIESFSGIRGIWGESLTEDVCRRYGFAYGTWLRGQYVQPKIVLGTDTRPSRIYVKRALLEGLAVAEVTDIIDVGILSTPAVENAVRAFRADGGIIITASHNPPEHNGMKFLHASGAVLPVADAALVITAAHDAAPPTVAVRHLGIDRRGEAIAAYLAHLEQSTGLQREDVEQFSGRILFDPNGGAGAEPAIAFAKHFTLGADFFHEKLGDFWRPIEPKVETIAPLATRVADQGCAFACAFDCDADRMEIVLPTASAFGIRTGSPVVSGQYVLALVVQALLETRPEARRAPIIVNDATSQVIAAIAAPYQTPVEEVEVGETNVVTRMLERQSLVGGEGSSGGSIVAPGQCRDGVQALAIILKYLVQTGQTLDQALMRLPVFITLATKVQCAGEQQAAVRQGLIDAYRAAGARVVTSGGADGGVKAWVQPDGWVWFRASKTEPGIFRCIADAKDRTIAYDLLEQAKMVFARVAG